MFLTDAEQKKLLVEEGGPITGRIRREIAVAVRQVEERQRQIAQKVNEHESFIEFFRRSMGSLVKGTKN